MAAELIWLVMGLTIATAADVSTAEQRARDSSLHPEYQSTWRSSFLRLERREKPQQGEPPLVACYRKELTLSAKPRQAALTVYLQGSRRWWLYVNGQTVVEPLAERLQFGLRNLDITGFLRAGSNVLALQGELHPHLDWIGSWAAVEGIVFGEDGNTTRILTDGWKGAWNLSAGWEKPGVESPELVPVRTYEPLRGDPGSLPPLTYYGPIQIAPLDAAGREVNQPIFDQRQPIALKVILLNSQNPGGPTPTLAVEVMDEFSREVIAQQPVALQPLGGLDLAGMVRHDGLPAGAYRFRFVLKAGDREVDRRDYEVACVGPIPQRFVEGTHYEDGLDLKLVWSIDCTGPPKPGEFIAGVGGRPREEGQWQDVETRVEEGPAGRYRTLAENRDFWFFAYRYKVRRLYVPHLVVIEWPDDAARSFIAHVVEGTTAFPATRSYHLYQAGGYQRGEASVVAQHDLHPRRSNQMQKLHILYWPNELEAGVHVTNIRGAAAPAAAARIHVYEIANDLPALRIADAGDRMIGYHTERGPQTMASTYYAGPLGAYFAQRLGAKDHPEFYRNWYTTTSNWIKRMRFSGQNLYLMGHFMYDGTLYPSQLSLFGQNTYGGGDVTRDYLGLMLRMFQHNGMKMISGIEYASPQIISGGQPSIEEVRAGAATLLTVGRNGEFCPLHNYPRWPAPNYFHPKVQESILAIVEELAGLYKDYPAWKGVALILSRVWGPVSPAGIFSHPAQDPLDWGYEDYTIDRFQEDTGVRIPVAAADPQRFQKRYEWLIAHARQRWIDWRCDQYTRLYRRMRDVLVAARPDLTLYLCDFEPYMASSTQTRQLEGHYDDPEAMKRVIRSFGLDLDVLRKEPGMVLSYSYILPGSGAALGTRDHRGWRELEQNEHWQSLFANDGKGGAYLWGSIPHYGAFFFPKGKWLFQQSQTRQGYFWSTYPAEAFVNVMARSNPTWIGHTWMDVCESMGRIHELRQFARAYRSLPNGRYERLAGSGRDGNVWLSRTTARDGEYAYAANLHWWDVRVTLSFADGATVHDLIKDRPVVLQGDRDAEWTFPLGPYEVQTFRITGAKPSQPSAITAARVEVARADDVKAVVQQQIVAPRDVVARARSRESELRTVPGWQRVTDLEGTLADIERLMAAGDLARAYEKATSWPLQEGSEQVVWEALEAIPFFVLGPFGKAEDTQGAGKDMGNPDVVADYRGMETPFLGESDPANLSTLVPEFKPDLSKTYRVYPGKDARWQEVWKTYDLSFYGKCHSEHPLWMVAYAYTEVYSPQPCGAVIRVGSPHAIWVWVNDRLVLRHGGHGTPRGGQRPAAPDQNSGTVRLKSGWNRVLLKVVQRGQATRVFFRITDPNGQGLDTLRYRVPLDASANEKPS